NRRLSETLEQMRANRSAIAARKRAGRETPTEILDGKRLRTRKNSNWCTASFLQKRIHSEWCCFLGLSATPAALRSAFAPARYSQRRESVVVGKECRSRWSADLKYIKRILTRTNY